MKVSELFTKTLKQAPADEVAKNAQLLIQAGYIYKVMAGVYAYTPLGLQVLENIKTIVREEMNAIGGQELIMSSLQRKETWETTTRWDDEVVDVWFKSKLKDGTEVGFGWSHEEAILEMLKQYVQSYNDLPISLYQFQTKLRNELRAKSGIMRGREFVMKDLYSLHATQEDMDQYYEKVIEAYKKIYERLGLASDTHVAFASGGAFTKFSHEFQTVCDAGEDVLYMSEDGSVAVNEEVLDDATNELGVSKESLKPVKTAETGNIFKFGTEKCEQMGVLFSDKDGNRKPAYLASYGIGITRLMGVIVEKFSDEKGMVWPENIAPAKVYLIRIGEDESTQQAADELYQKMQSSGVTVLYDDRDERPGTKFADADLMGIPHRVVVSAKTISAERVEYKSRTSEITEMLSVDSLFERLK
ncbi:MAG TPA: His/Gly/Thr/Pro-type tRNA ligase C-terminal domain-containing protein [Candidatus Saccharibacteria bacterium]|jgi:prolyl-tRNA synthetase|nr:His/Gly/Thr/Pro-type tRNA ligase C-terminal domain-containing protein [Candidatus Saccharibacteria bacterium]